MKAASHFCISARSRARGVALVIVLAFVVLLTGLLVAFFSRAVLDRQISNSSASQTKVELFAQGAVDTIIGDLKQEIAAGSTASTPAAGVTIYSPKTPASAVPALVGSTGTAGLENLVKRSAGGQAFYPSAGYDANASNRAAAVSTLARSQNGRTIAPKRWNKHLLLEKASTLANGSADTNDSIFTPVGATEAAGSTAASWQYAPDWILVDRNGSNPKSLPAAAPVLGRYAYAIYDEGGLLDMNVAGSPSGPNLMTSQQTAYKTSLALADLKQLPGISNLIPATRQDDIINALVGWRNSASASTDFSQQPPVQASVPLQGPFPAYKWNATSVPPYSTNYVSALLASSSGFLRTSNPFPVNGQTDRMFSSRQELLRLLLQGAATSDRTPVGAVERANLQNSLRFMGTFSRDINQPSFAPNPNRPKIGAIASGGNDMVGKDTGVAASNINPSFLLARVPASPAMIRNDGSAAAVGEPIVKKRFALNRLAWLTFQGVSASRNIANPPSSPTGLDYDIYLLENNYNVSRTLLLQGNAANVYRYFGLSWVSDSRPGGSSGVGDGQMKWVYNHTKPNPVGNLVTSPITTLAGATTSAIYSLSQVAAAGREPDFVELLKATICAGSLGKAAISDPTHPGNPGDFQNGKDVSVDASVIQIAANIIDQFDTDGTATRILFDDGGYSTSQEFRGVEDLPYFYALRGGYFPVKNCVPAIYNEPYQTAGGLTPAGVNQFGYTHRYDSSVFTEPGLGVAFQEPEIWNPHAWSSTSVVGPRPTQFRLTAVDAPATIAAPPASDPNQLTVQAAVRYVSNPGPDTNPPYNYCPVSTSPQHAVSLTPDSSALAFTIPGNRLDLFREPTLLIKPGVPSGSQLQFGPAHQINNPAESALINYYKPDATTGCNGLQSIVSGPMTGTGAADNNLYIGIYLGCFPLYWHDSNYVYTTNFVNVSGAGRDTITYRLQYQDPINSSNWVTYDEKYANIIYDSGRNNNTPKGIGNAMGGDDNVVAAYLDPRSSRFGMVRNLAAYNLSAATLWMPVGRDLSGAPAPYAGAGNRAGWAGSPTGAYNTSYKNAAQQNALWTIRPDQSSGFSSNNFSAALGWYISGLFRPGVLSQNNPAATQSNNRFNSDAPPYNAGYNGGEPGTGGAQYFTDPDGVVRRGMSAYLQPYPSTAQPAPPPNIVPSGAATGNPQAVAYTFSAAGTASPIGYNASTAPNGSEAPSRPIVLNRPFRTVAELGYVYSGTPWRNLEFSTPESGSAALLDVFSTNDTDNADGLVAGKVNLNTRQPAVLQAILAGAGKEEFNPATSLAATGTVSAQAIAQALVARTNSTATGLGPLTNIGDLVGKWNASTPAGAGGVDGGKSYLGFSGVAATPSYTPPNPATDLSAVLAADLTSPAGYTTANVPRYRESVVRALSNTGTTRVWNMMIDVVAQTGRYTANTTDLKNFIVEGEQRYWVHLAIDRQTGRVIDKQIEVVKE